MASCKWCLWFQQIIGNSLSHNLTLCRRSSIFNKSVVFNVLYSLSPSTNIWSRSNDCQIEFFKILDQHNANKELQAHCTPAVSPKSPSPLWNVLDWCMILFSHYYVLPVLMLIYTFYFSFWFLPSHQPSHNKTTLQLHDSSEY